METYADTQYQPERNPGTTDFFTLLDTFVNCTNEKQQTLAALEQHVLPTLKNRHTYADIGCGNGVLTSQLARHFQRVIAVDINTDNLRILSKRMPAYDLKLQVTDMNEYHLDEPADLVLFSYSIGYVGSNYSSPALRNVYRLRTLYQCFERLNAGGALVLIGSLQQGNYQHLFDYLQIPVHDDLMALHHCIRDSFTSENYTFPVEVVTRTLEEMVLALRLIVYDDGTRYLDRLEKIEQYASLLRQPDGRFYLRYETELLMIRK